MEDPRVRRVELLEEFLAAKDALAKRRQRTSRLPDLYLRDPVAFVSDLVIWPEGQSLATYQAEALSDVVTYGREAIRGPRGLGKSTILALFLLYFALTRDGRVGWKAPTVASAWLQLTQFLWPEIHKWANRLDWSKLGRERFDRIRELQILGLVLSTGRAFAAAPGDSAAIEGAHEESMAFIWDEAKSIPEATWDAGEGSFASVGERFALAGSTPGPPAGRFYKIHAGQVVGWKARHITIDEAISAGRVNPQWVKDRETDWGPESALFKNYVLGEFATMENQAIPLEWVEESNRRWEQLRLEGAAETPVTAIGADPSDTGSDLTAIAIGHGMWVEEIRYTTAHGLRDEQGLPAYGVGLDEAEGLVGNLLERYPESVVVVDVAPDAKIISGLKRRVTPSRVIPFNSWVPTDFRDESGEIKFKNVRAAAYWNLKEMLDPSKGHGLALPPDERLMGDLTAPTWLPVGAGGKMQLEGKDEIRKRLGRSTDASDAVAYLCWASVAKTKATVYGARIASQRWG